MRAGSRTMKTAEFSRLYACDRHCVVEYFSVALTVVCTSFWLRRYVEKSHRKINTPATAPHFTNISDLMAQRAICCRTSLIGIEVLRSDVVFSRKLLTRIFGYCGKLHA
jgi:hypothetical protein